MLQSQPQERINMMREKQRRLEQLNEWLELDTPVMHFVARCSNRNNGLSDEEIMDVGNRNLIHLMLRQQFKTEHTRLAEEIRQLAETFT